MPAVPGWPFTVVKSPPTISLPSGVMTMSQTRPSRVGRKLGIQVPSRSNAARKRCGLGVPLGPGHPIGLLHALGARDDWEDLTVAGALLTDLYDLFTKPTVRFLSGFFGPI